MIRDAHRILPKWIEPPGVDLSGCQNDRLLNIATLVGFETLIYKQFVGRVLPMISGTSYSCAISATAMECFLCKRMADHRAHLVWGSSPQIAQIDLVMFSAKCISMFLQKTVNLLDRWPFVCKWTNMHDLGHFSLVETLQVYLIQRAQVLLSLKKLRRMH